MRIARLLGITLIVLLLGAGGWWFFLGSAPPDVTTGEPVRRETFDTSLLRDQLFTRLRAPRQVAPAQTRGRDNPFAPPVFGTPPPPPPTEPAADAPPTP